MPDPIRVLHVVGAMNRGGVESWLMALLRHADRSEIAMDFLVHTNSRAAYDDEILARGSHVIACPSQRSPGYLRAFSNALARHGRYDVLHSHVHWFSGVTTTLARRRGIPVRIAHSHSDTRSVETASTWLRSGYCALMRRAIQASATHLLAASEPAADALFGSNREERHRASVVYCGLDFSAFSPANHASHRASVRQEFGIEPDEVVIGHVGAFHAPKNHSFLCSLASCAARRERRLRVLCAGAGPLEHQVRKQFAQAGIRAILTGLRPDVPRLLCGMDVFVFPSLYEGLPLAVIEAQAAGLPCIVSTAVTPEVEAVPGLIHRLALEAGPDQWAESALASAKLPRRPASSVEALRESPFDVERSFARVRAIYQGRSS